MDADNRTPAPESITAHPEFDEALRTWGYIGLNSFGGPAGQIAVMHRVLVDEKRWISEERFLHALNYCMLLPGPEAQQLTVYVGWLLHGVRGGLAAGLLFVWPGILAILMLSYLYAGYQQVGLVQSVFFGLKAAVLAIVAEAVLRIGRRALKSRFQVGLAAAAFAAIYIFDVPFPLIVLGAALLGLMHGKFRSEASTLPAPEVQRGAVDAVLETHGEATRAPALRRTIKVGAIWLAIWFAPVALLFVFAGSESVYYKVAAFFSQAATVTFGGAYSVLAYIAQEAVNTHGWLKPGEMLDGLAMAETTPGPLIMVVQFVGFLAAYREPGPLSPMLAGTLAALLTTWVTFAPCFLWIFLGAPYIEALRGNKALNAALSAITAAVVGVILNLAVWFALHALFATVHEVHGLGGRLFIPEWGTINWAAALLATGALIATFRFHVGMVKVLAACALGGVLLSVA